MKAILEFSLPEDQDEYEIYNRAMDTSIAIDNFNNALRGLIKYDDFSIIIRDKDFNLHDPDNLTEDQKTLIYTTVYIVRKLFNEMLAGRDGWAQVFVRIILPQPLI